MKTKNKINKHVRHFGARLKAGFSLVELLVVIAVIGIIAAIAIPNIAGITGSADTAKAQRNAQNLASTFAAARAAGADNSFATETLAVDALIDGGVLTFPSGSNFTDDNFRVPGLSDTERDLALGHLNLSALDETGQLEYTP